MDATWYTLAYSCQDCGEKWQDEWDCQVDSECPGCGCDCTPLKVLDEELITHEEAARRTS